MGEKPKFGSRVKLTVTRGCVVLLLSHNLMHTDQASAEEVKFKAYSFIAAIFEACGYISTSGTIRTMLIKSVESCKFPLGTVRELTNFLNADEERYHMIIRQHGKVKGTDSLFGGNLTCDDIIGKSDFSEFHARVSEWDGNLSSIDNLLPGLCRN